MEQGNVYQAGLSDWNVLNTIVNPTYYCPSRRSPTLYKNLGKSDYAANIGTNTNGMFLRYRNGSLSFADVTDGLSDTLCVGEARIHRGYMDSGGCCGDNESAYLNGFGDDVERRVINPPGPDLHKTTDLDSLPDEKFGSSHPGGFHALLGDGSTRTINYNIDFTVYQNFGIRDDGNVLSTDDL